MGLFGYCVLARVRWYDPLALRPVFNPRWPLAAACFWQNFFCLISWPHAFDERAWVRAAAPGEEGRKGGASAGSPHARAGGFATAHCDCGQWSTKRNVVHCPLH